MIGAIGFIDTALVTCLPQCYPERDLAPLIAAPPVFIVGRIIRTLQEERMLRAHLGAAYDGSAACVGRFLPGVI